MGWLEDEYSNEVTRVVRILPGGTLLSLLADRVITCVKIGVPYRYDIGEAWRINVRGVDGKAWKSKNA